MKIDLWQRENTMNFVGSKINNPPSVMTSPSSAPYQVPASYLTGAVSACQMRAGYQQQFSSQITQKLQSAAGIEHMLLTNLQSNLSTPQDKCPGVTQYRQGMSKWMTDPCQLKNSEDVMHAKDDLWLQNKCDSLDQCLAVGWCATSSGQNLPQANVNCDSLCGIDQLRTISKQKCPS
jgi:hypothetical protein